MYVGLCRRLYGSGRKKVLVGYLSHTYMLINPHLDPTGYASNLVYFKLTGMANV